MRRILVCLAIGMLTVAAYAQWVTDEDVPAYHATAPVRGTKLPPLLSGSQLDRADVPVSLAKGGLRGCGQGTQRAVPAALLLPLRPGDGAHQPAQLF